MIVAANWTIGRQLFLIPIFILSLLTGVIGQEKLFTYSLAPMVEVVKEFEQEANVVINYDPELLVGHQFSGQLNFAQPQQALSQLFDRTPFLFEWSNNTVLLLPAPVKEYIICGKIVDQQQQTPLPFANIYLSDYSSGTQSNEDGFFEWRFSTHINEQLIISYLGYQSITLEVATLAQGDCPEYTLALDYDLLGGEIIVKDYLLDGITKGEAYSGVRMDYDQISSTLSALEQDILKATQLLPGITSVDESATNLQIRGSTTDQNLILWEGATLYAPGHLFGMISAINPFVVEEVNIYTGVVDPSYDNRVGGIIDMSLSDSIGQQWHGGVGTTFSEAHAFVRAPIFDDKFSVLLSGRHNISGVYQSPTLSSYANKVFQLSKVPDQQAEAQEGEAATRQELQFYDWNAKVIFKPSNKLLFKAALFRSFNSFNYQFTFFENQFETTDQVTSDATAFSGTMIWTPNKKSSLNIALITSKYSNEYFYQLVENNLGVETSIGRLLNEIKDEKLAISYNYKPSKTWAFDFGYDYSFKETNYNLELRINVEPDYEDINNTLGDFHNFFTAVNYQQRNFHLNAGLRLTNYPQHSTTFYSPRLNLQYALNPHLKFNASAGVFHQFISQLINFGQNELQIDNAVWVLSGEETNSSMRADKFALGLTYDFQTWLFNAEAYYHKVMGLNTLYAPVTGRVEFDFSPGSSTAKGIDFLLKKRWAHYSIWANYSLSEVRYQFPDLLDGSFYGTNDNRHNFSLVNNWSYNRWTFSLSWQWHSGLPYSIPQIEEDINEETEERFYYTDYEDLNDQRLRDYSRVDLGIQYRLQFKQSKYKAEIALSLINLLNRSNALSREYFIEGIGEDGEEIALFEVERKLLRRTPQVLIRFFW